jgi:signal peptidase II
MPRRLAPIVLVLIALLVTGCDQATKAWAEDELSDGPKSLVSERVELAYHQNRGIAFNAERLVPPAARGVLLIAGAAAVVVLGVAWYRRRREVSPVTAGYALVVAGAAGNLIDRIARGYVVDFVHVHGWPVFNVADVAIAAGAVLLVASSRARHTARG